MATAVTQSTQKIIGQCATLAREILQMPVRNVWIDYDEEADVLYMSFRRPQRATKTVEVDEDVLVRKDGKTIVGVTIMNASTRK